MTRPNTCPRNLYVFGGVGYVALANRYPVPYDARADHVGNKFILVAIPNKQHWTGATPPVQFIDLLRPLCRKFDFVLRHPGGPKQAYDASFALLVETRQQRRRILAQVAARALHLPLLIQRRVVSLPVPPDYASIVRRRL